MCKMTPISVRLNLQNLILISCSVLELLRKVSQGGGISPPGTIGLVDQFENVSVQSTPRSTQMIFDKTPDKSRLEQVPV